MVGDLWVEKCITSSSNVRLTSRVQVNQRIVAIFDGVVGVVGFLSIDVERQGWESRFAFLYQDVDHRLSWRRGNSLTGIMSHVLALLA